jgi:tetratricopeptide (TPR) repeat protein
VESPVLPELARHLWITPQPSGGCAALATTMNIGVPLVPVIDANRRLRGPYTAAGRIVQCLAPAVLSSAPEAARAHELVHAHELEILTVAPELRGVIPSTHDTLTSLAIPKERTRFYSHNRTARLAHGLAEFIGDVAARTGAGRRCLVIDNLQDADPTDQEFVTILLRRIDPALLTLVIGTTAPLAGGAPLETALERYAHRHTPPAQEELAPQHPAPHQPAPHQPAPAGPALELAAEYVASHCTADRPGPHAAYSALDDDQRRRLHDAQADALEAAGEASLRLGAIPFHRERGSDPSGQGAAALVEALDYCVDMGFYEATVDLGERGRAVIDWQQQPGLYWTFTTKMTTSLAALGRPEQAHLLYEEARALFARPLMHMQAAYATAMLYTRHYEDEHRDHDVALRWINLAIAIATTIEDPRERAFNTVFNENGKALIEAHRRRPEEALRLVTEGLARLDRELAPGEHLLHRSVLLHNRAQVLTGLGHLDQALADYDTIIERDPRYDEYYFDRAGLLRRLGRYAEALADYDTAISLSPPFPEFHYNRADLRAETGDLAGALSDFGYVLELDPEHLDARINRGALLAELEDFSAAREDSLTGLEQSPDNPHLLCLLGRIEFATDRVDAAMRAFDAAIAADPALPQAWAARGEAAFAADDLDSALGDLDRSLDLAQDAAVFFNRGVIHQAREQWDRAAADFSSALVLAPDDGDTLQHLEACRAQLADSGA